MKTKRCSKCKQELPATTEFFYRNRRNKDGLRCSCKECDRPWHQQHYQKNKEAIKKYKQNHLEDTIDYCRRYRRKNKERIKERAKKRFNNDPAFWRLYNNLHARIRRRKPRQEYCTICNRYNARLELANISGKYKEDINDYMWLCRQCHYLFDSLVENYIKNVQIIGVS